MKYLFWIIIFLPISCSKMSKEELDDVQFKLIIDILGKDEMCLDEYKAIVKLRDSVYKTTFPRCENSDGSLKFKIAIVDAPISSYILKCLTPKEAQEYFGIKAQNKELKKAIDDSVSKINDNSKHFKTSVYPNRMKFSERSAPLTLLFSRYNERIISVYILTTYFPHDPPFGEYYDEFGVDRMENYLLSFQERKKYFFYFDKTFTKIQKMVYMGPIHKQKGS